MACGQRLGLGEDRASLFVPQHGVRIGAAGVYAEEEGGEGQTSNA